MFKFSSLLALVFAARLVAAAPCDIYASGGTPCVAAHSSTRALFDAYSGDLYQIQRASDSATNNIGPLSAGGVANAAAQDSFCAGTTCVITTIFDQSGRSNHLTSISVNCFNVVEVWSRCYLKSYIWPTCGSAPSGSCGSREILEKSDVEWKLVKADSLKLTQVVRPPQDHDGIMASAMIARADASLKPKSTGRISLVTHADGDRGIGNALVVHGV
ncbi:alpha-L-arabinofuranosidase B, catalytic-domain-containing protein [Mycena alexandri]|uniref:Alpha-L-arabinofuranosidase n=1 Tax=Mycena alexandri TaxID=1745969 RepID=A0AAD6TC43_9AGAR|nr:alpha-L-arabinofuranosidase B, catalytic-domain-containing protein [Mycena alexandri]